MQHNTLSKHNQKLPFTRYDFGWVLLCIGMAIGAGTVLMPVQIGLKGIWVFITAAIIAYPATWVVQDIYLKTLSESDSCNDYTDYYQSLPGEELGNFPRGYLLFDDYPRDFYLLSLRGFSTAPRT
ncbi:transport protein YhjV [Escherichia coli]|nr:transport protein YhjV [Escherichia coli]